MIPRCQFISVSNLALTYCQLSSLITIAHFAHVIVESDHGGGDSGDGGGGGGSGGGGGGSGGSGDGGGDGDGDGDSGDW